MADDPSNADLKLAALLQRTFEDLPERSAPASLEQQVQAQLQLRAQAWWRRHFALWPAATRVGFVALCLGLIGLTVLVGSRHEIDAAAALWIRTCLTLVSSAGGFASVLYRLIPPAWWYAGLLVGALLYALLFGLGAIAYRALYVQPSNGR